MTVTVQAPERLTPDTAACTETTSFPRRRILLSAFATSPYQGSEPGIGWNVASRLARYHDVTVLCFPGFGRDAVESFQRYTEENGAIPGLTIHWVEQPWLSRLLQREGLWQRAFYYYGYASWQRAAYKEAARLHAQQPFDLVHHLNISGFREPGYLWKMDLPFLWGPVAGAASISWPFFKLLNARDKAFYGTRNLLNVWHVRTKRRCLRAAAKAKQIWAVDQINQAMIKQHFHGHADLMLDTGCQPIHGGFVRDFDGRRPLRLLWSGVHEGRKCLPILLHGLARLKRRNLAFSLTVLGEGPETRHWQKRSRDLGLGEAVEWTGMLTQPEAIRRLPEADVFVLSSLQEGATLVVMEALASGLPVVCHDAYGMGTAVDETCGVKVPLIDPQTSVTGFTQAIEGFIHDPAQVQRLSSGALARAQTLSWDSKAQAFAQTYHDVLTATRP